MLFVHFVQSLFDEQPEHMNVPLAEWSPRLLNEPICDIQQKKVHHQLLLSYQHIQRFPGEKVHCL